jgi:hypothetical protein
LLNKDEEKCKAGLLQGHDTPGNLSYVRDTNQYRFVDFSEVRYDEKAKSIMISISVKILRDDHIDESTVTYYFKRDHAGEWKIALID